MTEKQILEKLERIERKIDYIEEHMVDADTMMTPEEHTELDIALKELRERKTASLKDIKKDRQNA
jgi:hypothetical protein